MQHRIPLAHVRRVVAESSTDRDAARRLGVDVSWLRRHSLGKRRTLNRAKFQAAALHAHGWTLDMIAAFARVPAAVAIAQIQAAHAAHAAGPTEGMV